MAKKAQAQPVKPKKEKETQPVKKEKAGSSSTVAPYYGTGKRKSAIAKVWVRPGKGAVEINDKPVEAYLNREILVQLVHKPMRTLKLEGKYDIRISTLGGGIAGQAVAAQLGIARALLQVNEAFRGPLKEAGLLTRDSRIKERKKYGRKKARKGPQYRKR